MYTKSINFILSFSIKLAYVIVVPIVTLYISA